jgi:hypothetical protein
MHFSTAFSAASSFMVASFCKTKKEKEKEQKTLMFQFSIHQYKARWRGELFANMIF